jgi:DNA topoisomerase-1
VNHGKINATLPKGTDSEALTLEAALEILATKGSGSGAGGGRVLGDHPSGGSISVREGRFGPYVNVGKVNATIPKSISPDSITLQEAIELIDAKGGVPTKSAKGKAKAGSKTAKTAPAKKAAPAKESKAKAVPKAKAAAKKKPAAKGKSK